MAREPLKFSVVVPLGPNEPAPLALLSLLAETPQGEVIVSAAGKQPDDLPGGIDWLAGRPGRGRQLNCGAEASRASWLWFVHADSVVSSTALDAVRRFADRREAAIGYCDLRFQSDGPKLVTLNAIGANWRSRLLGLPYGDQGLCLPAEWFWRLHGFREELPRGEDLDLVVRARSAGLRTRRIGARIYTSARRYRERGWLPTTLENQRAAWRLIRNARLAARNESA